MFVASTPHRAWLRLCIAATLLVAGCQDAGTRHALVTEPAAPSLAVVPDGGNVVLLWNQTLLEAIRTTPIGPPQTARALAMVHSGMYDAWSAYDATAVGTQLGGSLRRPAAERTLANKNEAISFAAHRMLSDLFPSRARALDAQLAALGYDPANATLDVTLPAGIGNRAARALLEYCHTDGSNQLNGYADVSGYQPVNRWDHLVDPARWQPLRVPNGDGSFTIQQFIAPHWMEVKPFALASASQLRPPPPAPLQSGEFHRQAQEVINMSARLGDREKVIAEYWADGPRSELPPGHWNLFAQFVSHRDGHSLDDDVKMFFAMNNAVFDAGIVAWEAKRFYDYVRPVTAIHHLKAGKKIRAWAGPYRGTAAIDGEHWQPYQALTFVTPPFAEYVSGHSTFSAAAAEILERFTGSDRFGASVTIPAGWSRVEPGAVPARDLTLHWPTFSAAADEAGISRLYGGIHFRDGDLNGRIAGRQVGELVWNKAQSLFAGSGR